uniref:Uncharacterized protein n=1 Tax=Noccaea caerulescens TaxID=107243 RepID=A0A1J3GG88_NOCCA
MDTLEELPFSSPCGFFLFSFAFLKLSRATDVLFLRSNGVDEMICRRCSIIISKDKNRVCCNHLCKFKHPSFYKSLIQSIFCQGFHFSLISGLIELVET